MFEDMTASIDYDWISAIDFKWLITTLIALIAAFGVWYKNIILHRNEQKLVKQNKLRELQDQKSNYTSLESELTRIIQILDNDVNVSNYQGAYGIKLINFKRIPKFEVKIDVFNKSAEYLSELSYGYSNLAKSLISENILICLNEINNAKKNATNPMWKLGNFMEHSLSELLFKALKDKIILGEKIDKPFFDSLDPMFYKSIEDVKGEQDFNRFLDGLNRDIEYQKDYGLIKLFNSLRVEVKNLALILIEDADRDTKTLDNEIKNF